MKLLKRLFLGILLLAILLFIGVYIYLQTSKPVYSGESTLTGLKEQVEVLYDEYGVPHIYATNEEDAYFALGYVHAQDRLFQMEMLRRAAGGRLSEVLGPDLINVDKLFRTLGLNQFAKEHAAKYLSGNTAAFQKAAHAYQRGVNEYVKTGKTPLEFTIMGIPKTAFNPEDIYLAIGFMSFGFAEGLRTDPVLEKIRLELDSTYLKDFAINTPPDAVQIKNHFGKPMATDSLIAFVQEALEKIPVPLWQGSNGWAIAGSRTASGMPILANDTHIGFSQPAVWYEAHIEYPGFRFYGHHIAGIPFGLLGQNDFCGWGLTMFENDDTDFFYEEVRDGKVKYKGEEVALTSRKEIINVKGGEAIEMNIVSTPHGNSVNGIIDFVSDSSQMVTLWWLLNHESNLALQACYQLNHASKFEDAEQSAGMFSAPGLNVMYSDVKGNIAWWAVAKLPVRPAHVQSKFFLDGASGKDENLGFYDFSKNPHSVNPPWGFVYSANNQPEAVDGVLYPGYYYPKSRAGRIQELLQENKKWTTEDVKKINLDVVSLMHANVAHEIAAVLKSTNKPEWDAIVAPLESWDGNHKADAVAPAVYYNILSSILKLAMADELGKQAFTALSSSSVVKNSYEQFIKNNNSAWWNDVKTTETETRTTIFELAALQTTDLLKKTCGSDPADWQWGKIHTLTHKHALNAVAPLRKFFNVGPFAVDGGVEVINNLHFDLDSTGYFPVEGGPALRKVTDFSDMENGETVSPTGQSGNVMSAYYSDQAEMFATGKTRKMRLSRKDIEANSKNRLLLKP